MKTKETDDAEVVWNGKMSRQGLYLLPPRATKSAETWTEPHRLYNKTGGYAKKGPFKCGECGALIADALLLDKAHTIVGNLHQCT